MSRRKNNYNIQLPSRLIREESIFKNNLAFTHYFDDMRDIALARTKWEGFPESIDTRFLEICLVEYGKFIAFRDEIADKVICLPFDVEGRRDYQGNPVTVMAHSPYMNMRRRIRVNEEPCAICYNNFIRKSDLSSIQMFAERMADCARTIEVNVGNQKTPKYVGANRFQKLTVENIIGNERMNCPVIYMDDRVDMSGLVSVDLTVPYVSDKLDMHMLYIWSEYLSYMGIDNLNQYKKERSVSAEVTNNEENVEISRNTNMECRMKFIEDFKRAFPEYQNVSVHFNSIVSYANIMRKLMAISESGGDAVGSIHNNAL